MLRTRRSLLLVLVVLVASIVGLVPGPASAQDAAGGESPATADDPGFTWAVEPSGPQGPGTRDAFTWQVAAGQELVDVVGVSNFTDQPLRLELYATDAFTTEDGSFALLADEDEPIDVGTWVELAASSYEVPPQSRVDIPFTVRVPADAEPGEHAGGIIAALAPVASGEGGDVGLDVRRRVGSRIYLTVDGEIQPGMAIEDLTIAYDNPLNPLAGGGVTVSYSVRNTGNVRLTPTAALEVDGPFGQVAGRAPDRVLPELLPGSAVPVTERFEDVWPLFRLSAELAVTAGDGDDLIGVSSSSATLAVPWLLVALVAMVLAVLVVRRRRRLRTQAADGALPGTTASSASSPVPADRAPETDPAGTVSV